MCMNQIITCFALWLSFWGSICCLHSTIFSRLQLQRFNYLLTLHSVIHILCLHCWTCWQRSGVGSLQLCWTFLYYLTLVFSPICSFIRTIVMNNIFFTNINFLQDPMISKMILSANDFGCSDEILTIASFLSVQVRFCISDTISLFLILF